VPGQPGGIVCAARFHGTRREFEQIGILIATEVNYRAQSIAKQWLN